MNLMLLSRAYSSGKPSPFNEEAVNSNLFDKAKATPLPSVEAGEAAERLAAEPSTAGRQKLYCGVFQSSKLSSRYSWMRFMLNSGLAKKISK